MTEEENFWEIYLKEEFDSEFYPISSEMLDDDEYCWLDELINLNEEAS